MISGTIVLDRRHLALVGPAGRDDDAVGLGAALGGRGGAVEQLLAVEQVVARNLGVGDLRLRAVAAVLGAQAALGVHQKVELHGAAEVPPPHAERRGQQVEQLVVRRGQHGEGLVLGQPMPVEHAVGEFVPAAGGLQFRRHSSMLDRVTVACESAAITSASRTATPSGARHGQALQQYRRRCDRLARLHVRRAPPAACLGTPRRLGENGRHGLPPRSLRTAGPRRPLCGGRRDARIRAARASWCAARAAWRWARCSPAPTATALGAGESSGQILRRMSVQDDLLEARLERRRHEAFAACEQLLARRGRRRGAGRRRAPVRRRGPVLLLSRRPAAGGRRSHAAAGRDLRSGRRVPQVRRHADRRLRPGLRHRGSQGAGRLRQLHELRGGGGVRHAEVIARKA